MLALIGGCGAPRQISDSGFGAYEVSLATWDDELAVAWYDTRDGNAEIYVRFLDADGREIDAATRLTTTSEQSYEADIVALDDRFAIAWYEKSVGGELHAQLGVWNRAVERQWTTPIGGAGESRNPVLRVFGDALFCAWIELDAEGHDSVWAGWWQLDGRPRGAPVRLGPAYKTTWNLNAAIDADGAAFVAFDSRAGTKSEELFLAKLADGRVELAQLTADDGKASKYPDIGFNGDQLALTWFDERDGNQEVYLAVGSVEQLSTAAEKRARRVTETSGHSIGAYLAWNGDRLGLAWSDDSEAFYYEVYFQPFDSEGNALTVAQRMTTTPAQSLIPAVRAWRDRFAIAWSEVEPAAQGTHDEKARAEVMFSLVR